MVGVVSATVLNNAKQGALAVALTNSNYLISALLVIGCKIRKKTMSSVIPSVFCSGEDILII